MYAHSRVWLCVNKIIMITYRVNKRLFTSHRISNYFISKHFYCCNSIEMLQIRIKEYLLNVFSNNMCYVISRYSKIKCWFDRAQIFSFFLQKWIRLIFLKPSVYSPFVLYTLCVCNIKTFILVLGIIFAHI